MRRAVSKKKEKDLKKHRTIFQRNGSERGIPDEVAGKIFDDIEFFARYGFNKSHAADYAVLTVQTAFLKAHYPHEYMAALLTIERGNTEKVGQYINDCRRVGINVLPPNVNSSDNDFTIELLPDDSRAIRYGLGAVKNVGSGAVEAIVAARQGNHFTDIISFCERVDLRVVGKRALECLIKVGALDSLAPRVQMLESLDRLVNFSTSAHKAADAGQMSLFGEVASGGVTLDTRDILVPVADVMVNRKELLQWERDLMGVYVSEHPLHQIYDRLKHIISATTIGLSEADHDRQVAMAGIVTYVRPHTTKAGKAMAFAGLEDLYGQIEVVIWPRTWDETRELWQQDRVLMVRGRVDAQRGEPKLLCDSATTNLEIVEAVLPPLPDLKQANDVPASEFVSSSGDEPPLNFDNIDIEMEPLVESNEALPELPDTDVIVTPSNGGPSHTIVGNVTVPSPTVEHVDDSPVPVANDDTLPMESNEPHRHITIHIKKGQDSERDRRKLQIVHGQFVSFPGADTFSIVIDSGDQSVEIEFAEETTRYCDELIGRLRRYVSTDAITVDNRP
jgi:DNA polymerase-3 subunit alpha